MDLVIKLNSEVAGKDKVARLLQYSCKALYDSLDAKNEAHLAAVHQLKSLEYILSSFRKRKTDKPSRSHHKFSYVIACFSFAIRQVMGGFVRNS